MIVSKKTPAQVIFLNVNTSELKVYAHTKEKFAVMKCFINFLTMELGQTSYKTIAPDCVRLEIETLLHSEEFISFQLNPTLTPESRMRKNLHG